MMDVQRLADSPLLVFAILVMIVFCKSDCLAKRSRIFIVARNATLRHANKKVWA